MENKSQKSELEIARRNLASVRARTAERIGRPNLNKFGKEKPPLAPVPVAGAKSAADALEFGSGRQKSSKQVDKEVVGDSIILKGKVKASRIAHSNVGQKKEALKISPTLTVPLARNIRATNKDGATSFHFKYEPVAKTTREKTSASGTKSNKFAGRDHSKYLERESAVARNGKAGESVELDGDGIVRRTVSDASDGGRYIEREAALAHHENGAAIIFSNISQDPDERHFIWEMIEKHERDPKPDHLKFVTGQAPQFWEAVKGDPRCPELLAIAIGKAETTKTYRVRTDDNEYVRQIMADHGWAPPLPTKLDETPAEKKIRLQIDHANAKGAYCEDGRGGRIQMRIVGELPSEVSLQQRIRILKLFTAEFEEKNLPYVAVMHAPNHANDKKNWHFHLAFHDQPYSECTGDISDYITELKPDANWHDESRQKAMIEAFKNGELEKYKGQLDFTIPMIRKDKSRHTVITYPFAQKKDRDCTKKEYPLYLRKLLAKLINDELEISGAERRVDPRRFSEMGISKTAEDHLGSSNAQMECLGIPTSRGVVNEHRQWQHTLDNIDKKLQKDQRDVVNQERCWRQRLESLQLGALNHAEINGMITAWAQSEAKAKELTAIANELKEHLERARSRALKVMKTCARHLQAIENRTANKRQRSNKANYLARWVEAKDHLSGLTVTMAAEIDYEKQTQENAVRFTDAADKLHQAIGNRMRDERAAMAIANCHHQMGEGYINQFVPINLNDDIEDEDTFLLDRRPSTHILKKYEMERFMKHLIENNRRLEAVGSSFAPVEPTDDEKQVINAFNYADLEQRLRKLKDVQDSLIDHVARYIRQHPKSIKVVSGDTKDNIVSYQLLSADPNIQRAFKGFAKETPVKLAVDAALKALMDEKTGASASTQLNKACVAEASQSRLSSPSSQQPAAAAAMKPTSLTQVMRKIDHIAEERTPIFRVVKNGQPRFILAPYNLNALGLNDSDIADGNAQVRLAQIYQRQDSEIKRLVGYIGSSPARAVTSPPTDFSNNMPVIRLDQKSPPELRILSMKFAEHPVAQKRMHRALHQALAELEIVKVAVETNRQQTAGELGPFYDKTVVELRDTHSTHLFQPRAKPDLKKYTGGETPLDGTRDSRRYEHSSSDDKKKSAALSELPPEQPAAPKLSEAQSAADRPSGSDPTPPEKPKQTSVEMLHEEEIAEFLRPRIFGITGGSRPAPRLHQHQREANKPSYQPQGHHPKIDAWISAFNARDLEARQIAALALKNERKELVVALGVLDPQTQVQIRSDWEAQLAKDRANIESIRQQGDDQSVLPK